MSSFDIRLQAHVYSSLSFFHAYAKANTKRKYKYLTQFFLHKVQHFIIMIHFESAVNFIFSSPELKAIMSFSDNNLYVVHRHCRRKLFTISSSSPEPQSQFQPNLAQSILGQWGFKFVQLKAMPFFQG